MREEPKEIKDAIYNIYHILPSPSNDDLFYYAEMQKILDYIGDLTLEADVLVKLESYCNEQKDIQGTEIENKIYNEILDKIKKWKEEKWI